MHSVCSISRPSSNQRYLIYFRKELVFEWNVEGINLYVEVDI